MESSVEAREESSTTGTAEKEITPSADKSNESTGQQFTRSKVYASEGLIFRVCSSLHSTLIPSER